MARADLDVGGASREATPSHRAVMIPVLRSVPIISWLSSDEQSLPTIVTQPLTLDQLLLHKFIPICNPLIHFYLSDETKRQPILYRLIRKGSEGRGEICLCFVSVRSGDDCWIFTAMLTDALVASNLSRSSEERTSAKL